MRLIWLFASASIASNHDKNRMRSSPSLFAQLVGRRPDLNLECPECCRPRGANVDAIFSADFCTSPSKASGSINELVAHPPTRCPGECIRQQRVGSSRWTEEIDCLLSEMAPQTTGPTSKLSMYTLRPRAHVCKTTTSNGRMCIVHGRKSDRLTFAIFWLQRGRRRRFCSAMHLFPGLSLTHWCRIQIIITFPPAIWSLYQVNKLLLNADQYP